MLSVEFHRDAGWATDAITGAGYDGDGEKERSLGYRAQPHVIDAAPSRAHDCTAADTGQAKRVLAAHSAAKTQPRKASEMLKSFVNPQATRKQQKHSREDAGDQQWTGQRIDSGDQFALFSSHMFFRCVEEDLIVLVTG